MKCNNLLFVYHTPFWIENGRFVTSHAAVGRYIDSLAPYFSEIILAVPAPEKNEKVHYILNSTNLKLDQLPHYHNSMGFWTHSPVFFWRLMQAASSCNILNIRMATHLGFLAYLAAWVQKKPIFLVVVGEFFLNNKMANYSYIKQKIVNADSLLQDKLMDIMIKKCTTFTNGEDLFDKYHHNNNHVFLMRSSTINLEDINIKMEPSPIHDPIRILTVGTVVPHKGTVLIPDIISILKGKGYKIEWHYLGRVEGVAGEFELRKTLERAAELKVSENLIFHGGLPWNDVMEYYHNSDLFVLPTYMEGIPRVLLESQAAGLPVISTSVGGIPKAIRNDYDGLLVPPGDSMKIAHEIERIITDDELHDRLVSNGLKTAKNLTLEGETRRMLQQVSKVLNIFLINCDFN